MMTHELKWVTDTHGGLTGELISSALKLANDLEWTVSVTSDEFWFVNLRIWKKVDTQRHMVVRRFWLRDAQQYKGPYAIWVREEVSNMVKDLKEMIK